MFEAFFKKDLAKRLLLGRSASGELERSVVARLKGECGPGFTNKLEGMFRDIDLSRDIMLEFNRTGAMAGAMAGGAAEATSGSSGSGGSSSSIMGGGGSTTTSGGGSGSGGGGGGGGGDDIEAYVHVLTVGFWPAYPPTELAVPPVLCRLQDAFGAAYLRKYSGRRLTWVHSLSHVVLKAALPRGRKELSVSLLQASLTDQRLRKTNQSAPP